MRGPSINEAASETFPGPTPPWHPHLRSRCRRQVRAPITRGCYLRGCRRDLRQPVHAAVSDEVMRPARVLTVPHRGTKRDRPVEGHDPVVGPERCDDLRSAPARAEVDCRLVLHGDVEGRGLGRGRDGLGEDRCQGLGFHAASSSPSVCATSSESAGSAVSLVPYRWWRSPESTTYTVWRSPSTSA